MELHLVTLLAHNLGYRGWGNDGNDLGMNIRAFVETFWKLEEKRKEQAIW